MSLPTIASYELPSPPNTQRVTWVPEARRAVLLVHDMQEYFLNAFNREAEPIPTMLSNMADLLSTAREHGVPVVYSCQPGNQHPHRRGLLADFWGSGMTTGPSNEIVQEIAPVDGDIVVTKWRYSAFERTDLRDILARAQRDQLLVTGVYSHLGCQVSAVDAFMADVQPFFVSDAMADFSLTHHQGSLDYVASSCGRVLNTASVCDHVALASRALKAFAEVPTERAERYANQLISHLSHKATLIDTGAGHSMHFPRTRGIAASGRIAAKANTVQLEVSASDSESLATAQRVIGGHLERFGSRENLRVEWN